jgi:DNA end-binding protein Ku
MDLFLVRTDHAPRFGLSRGVYEFKSMPASLWSGNLRLSLVLIPVKLHSAVTTEETISFRMIHEPSGQPIRYVKGIETEQGFEEVSEDEIVKGYEHTKGHHVLIQPEELDELRLEAKHTIDMVRFVDEADIDSRYWEKPYYLTPDGDEAGEGYVVIHEALKQTRKVAIGQLIMGGRGHLVGIKPQGKGLLLSILRYTHELRAHESYFASLTAGAKADAVALAAELIEKQSGEFEPQTMPDQYQAALHEYLRAKVEQRAPEVTIAEERKSTPQVINIMDALKESMAKQVRSKVAGAVRKRMGKTATKRPSTPRTSSSRPGSRRTAH